MSETQGPKPIMRSDLIRWLSVYEELNPNMPDIATARLTMRILEPLPETDFFDLAYQAQMDLRTGPFVMLMLGWAAGQVSREHDRLSEGLEPNDCRTLRLGKGPLPRA